MDLDANRSLIAAALGRIPAGDRAALQTVYRLTSAKLFGVCVRILGERAEAEDVLQEVYVTVWRKAADFDASRASPMTWLIALARNRSIDRLRASRVSRNMDPIDSATEVADMAAAADTALESVQEHARLHGCLDGLVSHERAALHGAFFDGNTYRRSGEAHERAAWHDEELDPPRNDQAEGLPRAMSETFDHNGLADDELLAAELALGVLEGAERATAERRATRDRGFARLVEDWEHRLAPWAAEIAEISQPPQVWERISSALPAQPSRAGLWHNLTFWRGASLAAGALAAACLAALLYFGVFIQQQPLVATIEGGGQRHFVATIDSGRGTVAVVPAAFSPDATRVPELWLIPPDGRPRAVGLLHADQTVVLTLPPELAALAKNNAVLAVSLEPPGGSTTGLPTGPVIATGKLTSL